ncbi:hypothetical protein ACE1SV_61690 [Streptomyces sennicomposti]
MGVAMMHRGKFPGEVVGVLDAGVGAEPAGGRDLVGAVPDQEDPSRGEAIGDRLRGVPGQNAVDLDRQPVQPRRPADVRDDPLGAEVLGVLAPIGVEGDLEDPGALPVYRQQRPWARGPSR